MAKLYFPAQQGQPGFLPSDWPGGLMPYDINAAKLLAQASGAELVDVIAEQNKTYNTPANTTITIRKSAGFEQPLAIPGNSFMNWFNANWKWAVPMAAIGLALILIPKRRY